MSFGLVFWRSPSSDAAFPAFRESIAFRSARFDDADSSWSLRSNYSCPVKYHNAGNDQFTAWGALIPLEAPVSVPVKVSVHQPFNSNEHSQDMTRTIMKIASQSTVESTSTPTYQPEELPPAKTPWRHHFQRHPPFTFQLPSEHILMKRGNQFPFQGRPPGPLKHRSVEVANTNDSIHSALWPRGWGYSSLYQGAS